jgi:hypothetical protein
MRSPALLLSSLLVCLGLALPGPAQEGHPLTGTWSGDWGPTPTERYHLTFVMTWDGANVTGVINPGPQAVEIGSVFLDVTNWTVRIQAEPREGGPIRAEGLLEDIESYHRTLTGTWRQGSTEGDFRLVRD